MAIDLVRIDLVRRSHSFYAQLATFIGLNSQLIKACLGHSYRYDDDHFFVLCLQNIMNLQYQYEDSDVLNVAVTGAKIRHLPSEITNLRNQLQELNDVCILIHIHTHSIVDSIAYTKIS